MRLGDDEGALVGVGPGAEGMAHDRGVVATAGHLEVGEVDGVVDVAERVGVAVADLDVVAVAELALEGRGRAWPSPDASAATRACRSADGAGGAVP